MEKQSIEELEDTLTRHIELIGQILIACDEQCKQGYDKKELLSALINIASSMAFAEGMSFDQFVYEVSLRYSALTEVHSPPKEGEAIH